MADADADMSMRIDATNMQILNSDFGVISYLPFTTSVVPVYEFSLTIYT